MKSHKAIMKVAYGVIGLAFVTTIALFVYQQWQIGKMDTAGSPETSGNGPYDEVMDSSAAIKTHPQDSDSDITDKSRRDNSYDVLFRELALSPEKQKALKEIFLDLQTQKSDLNMELLDTSISEEKREEILQRLVILNNLANEKARLILGAENYGKYLTYEQRLSERTLLTAFFRSLGPGEKLTELQEQAFIDTMYEERKKVETASPRDNEIQPPADLATQVSRVLETTDQIHSGYIKAAGMYLSPSRTEQFQNYLHQRRDMMELSLNAMRQVFGNDNVSGQSPEKPGGAAN